MSVVEVNIDREFIRPVVLGAESHLLARVEHEDQLCLAGIRAVMEHGTPKLDWAMKTSEGIVLPEARAWYGHLAVKAVTSLDLVPDIEITPSEILELPRVQNVDNLLWTKASMVYGIPRNNQARLDYR